MAINVVNLFKNVIDVPNFDRAIDRGRNDTVPNTEGQRSDVDDSCKMCI